MKYIAFTFVFGAIIFCSCGNNGRSSERLRVGDQRSGMSSGKGEVNGRSSESRQARLDGRVVTDEGEANAPKSEITAEMAYEGVSNYCHSAYDWSIAKDNRRQTESQRTCSIGRGAKEEGEANPSIMYVQMGEETDSTYQVVFRSYTGAFVNFYVDKASGTTRMEEYVPTLDVKSEAGTINLFDYLDKEK